MTAADLAPRRLLGRPALPALSQQQQPRPRDPDFLSPVLVTAMVMVPSSLGPCTAGAGATITTAVTDQHHLVSAAVAVAVAVTTAAAGCRCPAAVAAGGTAAAIRSTTTITQARSGTVLLAATAAVTDLTAAVTPTEAEGISAARLGLSQGTLPAAAAAARQVRWEGLALELAPV